MRSCASLQFLIVYALPFIPGIISLLISICKMMCSGTNLTGLEEVSVYDIWLAIRTFSDIICKIQTFYQKVYRPNVILDSPF